MSFLDEEDVYALTEELLATLWREILDVELPSPFPRMTYWEAMRRYGSDKPDLRLDLELVDLTDHMAGTEFRVFQAEHVGAVVVPGGAAYTRKELDALAGVGAVAGRQGHRLAARAGRRRRAARLDHQARAGPARSAARRCGCEAGRRDPVRRRPAPEHARAARRAAARGRAPAGPDPRRTSGGSCGSSTRRCSSPTGEASADGPSGWTAVHHPFTAPTGRMGSHLPGQPRAALARAYDVVGNGVELGGGSIRIHQARDAAAGLRRDRPDRARRRRASSASCSRRSSTDRRRTVGSRSGSTGWPRRSSAPTRSARSWRSRRRRAAATR